MLGRRRTIDDFGIASAPFVIVVVLISALMHASWNAVVKGAEEGLVTQADVVLGGALYAYPSFEVSECRGLYGLGLSALIHCAYLPRSPIYCFGDLGFIYPSRAATVPSWLPGSPDIGELLSPTARRRFDHFPSVLLVLLAAAAVDKRLLFAWPRLHTRHSLADGIGVRVSKRRFYIWLIAVQAIPLPFHSGDGVARYR